MNLISPERMVWLAVAVPIIAFYLLKTRLRREPVATLRFWEDVNERTRRCSVSLRIRHWLSLLLQLAFVLLVVAALVDPLRSGQDDDSTQWVLIIDTSASMQADLSPSEQRTRWQAAIDGALRHIESARPGDELALITAGSQVDVVVGMTDFPPVIRNAIEDLQVTDAPGNLQPAIATARRLAPDPARRRVFLFTDGCSREFPDEEGASKPRDLEWIVVGEAVDNVGITQMQTRRSFIDPVEYSVLVECSNFGEQPVEGRLVLRHDDRLLDVYPMELAPNETLRETFQHASPEGGIVTAQLQIDDAFLLDNLARAILPQRQRTPVTLVTDADDPFLPSVLSAMPDVDLTVLDQWLPQRDEGHLTVLHRVVPEILPEGPLLVIAPQADSELWRLQPALPETIISEQADSSLVLSNVALANVPVSRVTPLELPATATPLLKSAEGATVMASIVEPSRRTVILATELTQSDLPLRIAFPVIMSNAVRWLTDAEVDGPSAFATGETGELAAERIRQLPSFDAVQRSPKGPEVPVIVDGETVSVGPFSFTGIYRAVHAPSESAATNVPAWKERRSTAAASEPLSMRQGTELALAVNLMNASENDLRPSLHRSKTRQVRGRGRGGRGRPLWFYFTLAAFGLIVGEWFLFQRRIVA